MRTWSIFRACQLRNGGIDDVKAELDGCNVIIAFFILVNISLEDLEDVALEIVF